MSTKIGLGVPMPLLAPATATWAFPFAAYYLFLQNRITFQRIQSRTLMGDRSDTDKGLQDPLYVANRAQLNFAENVPLVLIVSLLAELNGANRRYISYALGALFAARVGHAEFGLLAKESKGIGRILGYYSTQSILVSLASYTAYLIKDYWQI